MANRVYIILLNWNGWRDTIECLSSVLLHCPDTPIILVDNNSCDGSMERIERFLLNGGHAFNRHTGDYVEGVCSREDCFEDDEIITLIENKKNSGYTGGNNIAMRYILAMGGAEYVWLLNTDTIIEKQSLPGLLSQASKDDRVGFVGSVLMFYHDKPKVQCYGGIRIYPFLGVARLYKKNSLIEDLEKADKSKVDSLLAASMLVRIETIRGIGMFDDSYFFYGEDMDWQYAGKSRGWKIDVARESIVYHKDRGSTKDKTHIYFFYLNRALIMFVKRWHGRLPLITASLGLILNTVVKNRFNLKNIVSGFRGVYAGLKTKVPVSID